MEPWGLLWVSPRSGVSCGMAGMPEALWTGLPQLLWALSPHVALAAAVQVHGCGGKQPGD